MAIYGTTGSNPSPVEKRDGGTMIGVTSATDTAGGPITQVFNVSDNSVDGVRTSVVQEVSGAGHSFNTTKGVTPGTFAYRQSQFMIRGVATRINDTPSTAILINGTAVNRQKTAISNKSKGSLFGTAYRAGNWRPTGISGQRTNWTTPPSSGSGNYVSTTNNAISASDQCQFVTYRTIPGELTFMYGAIDPKQLDYPANT